MFNKYNEGEITAGQFYVLIISMMIGTGILNLASEVSKISLQDAWISVFIAGLVVCVFTYLSIFLASRFKELTFLQYSSYLLSKPIAYLISILYFIYAIVVTSTILRSLSDMIMVWFLPRTPPWVIVLITLLTVVSIAKDGLTLVARFSQVLFFVLIPLVIFIFVPFNELSILNVMPVGGTGFMLIAEGTLPSIFAYSGYEIVLFLYPFIANKNKNISKTSAACVLLVTLVYTATVFTQIALFGYKELQIFLYPTINYLDVVDFIIIERIEIFFSILWIFTVIATVIIQFYTGTLVLQSIFNTRTNSLFAYILTPIVFFMALYPKNSVELGLIKGIIGHVNLFFGIALPLILVIMLLIKGQGSKNNEKKK